jgi:CRISPR system Cascade subunit CasA
MSMEFNLIDAPWIPCIRADGQAAHLELRDTLLQSHELRELAGESPLVTAALHRLLLAVLHRVFGPEDRDTWYGLWKAGRWDAPRLDTYLTQWRHRFNLFDPDRPFCQAADDRVKPKSLNSLVLDLAFGNKATLFDHHTDAVGVTLTPAESARAVVAAQSFGLAGLSGLSQKFTDGTCARGVLFLVQGETLFETLMLNMLRYPTDDDVMPHNPDDCPAWEMDDPFIPDRSIPRGYLDYLTWQNRRILLMPEHTPKGTIVQQMTVAPALRLESEVLTRDPMKHFRLDKNRGLLVQRFNEDRALWRDSAALFSLHSDRYRPPRTFQWLAELVDDGGLDVSQTRRYLALGMANNQAKVDFYRTECMPLPLKYLRDDHLVGRLSDVLTMAESVRGQLWGAARQLATLILSPQADSDEGRKPDPQDLDNLTNQWAVERDYWSRLEIPFRELLVALPDDVEGTLTDWRGTLYRTAWTAFDRVTGDLERDPRNLKATVCARDQLAAGLDKVLPKS